MRSPLPCGSCDLIAELSRFALRCLSASLKSSRPDGVMRWSPSHPARATLSQGDLFSEAIIMSELALVGIDLGKHTFHLHGQDKPGREMFRKKLSRQ